MDLLNHDSAFIDDVSHREPYVQRLSVKIFNACKRPRPSHAMRPAGTASNVLICASVSRHAISSPVFKSQTRIV
jgi:hypothetical protein